MIFHKKNITDRSHKLRKGENKGNKKTLYVSNFCMDTHLTGL